MIQFYKSFFLSMRFYLSLGVVIALYVTAFFVPVFFHVASTALVVCAALLLLDVSLLYLARRAVQAERRMSDRFSNGDENEVELHVRNGYTFPVSLNILDELPFQFQQRNFSLKGHLKTREEKTFKYKLRPVERGEYHFGQLHVYVRSAFGLVTRRYSVAAEKMVKVYPSFIQLRNYELFSIKHKLSEMGVHRKRVIGHSMEFDHIKEYIRGDDVRTLNWKATARRGTLMVNNFTEERSQQVYCVIDKGRNMKMPFDGLTLLDYAINASLVFSNVALGKGDKAGLVTFTGKQTEVLPASNKKVQLNKILEQLYGQTTAWTESDVERLGVHLRASLSQRSLLMLFTNFESITGLQRQLPFLRQIAKYHLLLVVFFENTEIKKLNETQVKEVEEIYIQVIAQKFAHEKKQIVRELAQYGIMSLLTTPEHLTVDVVNKYLELKSRMMA
ncbi:DUF58 domain-containing protein [Chitinophaga sp. GCM10012297]|uniref:DUF58 domain-containing protein n=1 Tax=Chitinophaga chungangae TaxID=2821488 RepID=A0ABS3YEI7_9BACT|nr:DUF58 domain-containing protein [Chitinophaga chungangae]MBO9153091.1 DUF58 domain-containing protein [Chitinophaga chungangae]